MSELSGACHCGNIQIEMKLSEVSSSYQPRACDCDFCLKQNISYISDPKGDLSFLVKAKHLGKYRQGSETAEFLFCKNCSFVVGVVYEESGKSFGAVNSQVMKATFGEKVSASPKKLSAPEKTTRWKQVWFSNVSLKEQE